MRTTLGFILMAGLLAVPATAWPCSPPPSVYRLLPSGTVDPEGDLLVLSWSSGKLVITRSGGASTESLTLTATCFQPALTSLLCTVQTPRLEPDTTYEWKDLNTHESGTFKTGAPKPAMTPEQQTEVIPVQCNWTPGADDSCGKRDGYHWTQYEVRKLGGSSDALLLIRGEDGAENEVVVGPGDSSAVVGLRGTSGCVETQWVRADGTTSEVQRHCADLPPCADSGFLGCSSSGQGASVALSLLVLTLLASRRRRSSPSPSALRVMGSVAWTARPWRRSPWR